MADTSQEYATILGPDAKFKGDLVFNGAAKILGGFEGSIKAKGKIFIADGSSCKATINAKEVSVEGRIEGNVEATDRVEVRPTGAITGDIVAARMVMADGASINGHCRIGNGAEKGAGTKASSTTEVKAGAERTSAEPVTAGVKSR